MHCAGGWSHEQYCNILHWINEKWPERSQKEMPLVYCEILQQTWRKSEAWPPKVLNLIFLRRGGVIGEASEKKLAWIVVFCLIAVIMVMIVSVLVARLARSEDPNEVRMHVLVPILSQMPCKCIFLKWVFSQLWLATHGRSRCNKY